MTRTMPNLLLIMSDQHRHDHYGAAGARHVHTPNLDRLAAEGVRFTQCVTPSPLCAPARIGLATGQHPSATGCLANSAFLPRSLPTHYQHFRDGGYRVGCVGKLDLAKSLRHVGYNGDRPDSYRWGFTHPEECEGKMHAGMSREPLGPYTRFLEEQGLLESFHQDYQRRAREGWIRGAHDSVLPSHAFEDSYIGRRAAHWISNVPEDFPWYYFVSFVGPHDPFDPPAEYADRYRDALMPAPIQDSLESKPECVQRGLVDLSAPEVTTCRRQYCAAIELIDDQIGMILDALANREMLENTIIVYSSDHGEMLGDHGMFNKSLPYESSIRVPLVVSGPGIGCGQVKDALVELSDVNPTLCELAGLPPQPRLDAASFVNVLSGVQENHRDSTVSSLYNFQLIRTRTRKYVSHVDGSEEVYDLERDPQEIENLAGRSGTAVDDLKSKMKERLKAARQLV